MKKTLIISLVIAVLLSVLSTITISKISAQEDGGDILFQDTKVMRHVMFSHAKHIEAKKSCNDCHPKIFQKKAGSTDEGNAITMKAIKRGDFCGACHNGTKAFKISSNCKKCHSIAKDQ